jgi:hypothetical protein
VSKEHRIRILNTGSQQVLTNATSVEEPGSGMFIPDPTFFHPNSLHPGYRILITEFKYFNPKKAKKMVSNI